MIHKKEYMHQQMIHKKELCNIQLNMVNKKKMMKMLWLKDKMKITQVNMKFKIVEICRMKLLQIYKILSIKDTQHIIQMMTVLKDMNKKFYSKNNKNLAILLIPKKS